MLAIQSYVLNQWHTGSNDSIELLSAIDSTPVARINGGGINFAELIQHGREANVNLRKMTFHQRALMLKALGLHLMEKKEIFYKLSSLTGATRNDSWIDIEGGIGTMLSYASLVRRQFPDQPFALEGSAERISAKGSFVGRHLLTPKRGVALHINAYNFPCWGMLEKIAPSLLAGMPVIVKPATVGCYLTEAIVRVIIDANILPAGCLQLVCGSLGDALDHLDEQDVVTFTGSAQTGQKLKSHANIISNSIPFNMEADSLNATILGETVTVDSPEFNLFVKEVVREMTVKAGQKCTAIRRIIVPHSKLEAVQEALLNRLSTVTIGNPCSDKVRMGALAGLPQRLEVIGKLQQLQSSCALLAGGAEETMELIDADAKTGAFFPPTLLLCKQPLQTVAPHTIEAFGPVSTLMPYDNIDEAIAIAHLGRGSLVSSLVTNDPDEATQITLNIASSHGRLLILNDDCAKESTGHGSPLATLVHGGPGRAGGGEELGGIRAVKHYMQRTALQSSPTMLTAISCEYHPQAKQFTDVVHPFRKNFDQLRIGETLVSHRRTVTETDVVNFGCLSGDHFYAHFDETAAKDSLFGKRVAHGYFLIAAAAGMFVNPAPGPVLANYGIDNLRFVEPVAIGDTIQVSLTVKSKTKKVQREDESRATGVVIWYVEISNQHAETVAVYDILTLVERNA